MQNIIGAIVFFILGTVLLVAGVTNKQKMGDFTKCEAEITSITSEGTGDDEKHHVMVKYTVDDKEYEAELDDYSSSYRVGKTVKIKYDPDNPNDIIKDSNFITYLGFILGPILMLLSGAYLILGIVYTFSKKQKVQ